MKTFIKIIARLFGLLLVLITALFISMSIVDSPVYAWRILTLFSSDTQDYQVFPGRTVKNGAIYSPIEIGDPMTLNQVEYRYRAVKRSENLADLLKRTDTRAFLIIKDDRLVYETYYKSSRDSINTSFSVAKSFDSALIGAAFHYNNFHPLLEGLILERATSMPVAEYLQERIWKPMGAEFPASWSLDSGLALKKWTTKKGEIQYTEHLRSKTIRDKNYRKYTELV